MLSSEREDMMDWLKNVPLETLESIRDRKIVTAGFGAGPACMAQHVEHFRKPIDLKEGLLWLDRWASTFRRARLVFDNGITLLFFGTSFDRVKFAKDSSEIKRQRA